MTGSGNLVQRAREVLLGLESVGIVTSTDACCGPCASEQVCRSYDAQPEAVGSAYFHLGDMAHSLGTGVLRIWVESGVGDDEERHALVRIVVRAFRAAGLLAEWTITDHARVEVRLKIEELYHA